MRLSADPEVRDRLDAVTLPMLVDWLPQASLSELRQEIERLVRVAQKHDVPIGASAGVASVEGLAGGASVNVSPGRLAVWATPQALAVATWLMLLLTLIGVILAVEANLQGPAPVNVVVVPPSNTRPTAP